jgi:predicted protein tyrosine phosphatase
MTVPPGVIIVCPLSHVPSLILERRPSHLITLLSPSEMIETPKGMRPERHLRIGVNDIAEITEGLVAPDAAMVERILAFGKGWSGASPLLIHCWAGISRSTATAFMLMCDHNPQTPEAEIAKALREASVHATPNLRFVALADDLLGRGGRMLDAAKSIGQGEFAMESVPFDLPAIF